MTTEKQENCCHHWQIDTTGQGICQKCGEVRRFPNLVMAHGGKWKSPADKARKW
ncbi:hypothetical protein ACFLTY_05430 [Chloroflexota bacterium]